jgi:hypothetical protein
MYDIVKKWEWGNSENPSIYHDPETRKNSISFRGNLHRLAEEFINVGNFTKAKEIIDLNFEKMPLDYFEYYSLSEPYISSYYKIGEVEKAQKLFKDLEKKYLGRIKYYSSSMINYEELFPVSEFAENIFTYTERYRGLIENEIILGNYDFVSESIENFIKYTEIFKTIYGEYDYYLFLTNFVEPLYISEMSENGRNLYVNISDEIKSRLKTLNSAKEDSNSVYVSKLFEDEINSANQLLSIIKNYETDEFYKAELDYLTKISQEFISK